MSQQVAGLGTEFVRDGLEDEKQQDDHPYPIRPAETGGVKQGKGGKERSAEYHQGGEGQFPFVPQGIDDHRAFQVGLPGLVDQGLSPLDEHQGDQQSGQQGDDHPPVLLQSESREGFKHG